MTCTLASEPSLFPQKQGLRVRKCSWEDAQTGATRPKMSLGRFWGTPKQGLCVRKCPETGAMRPKMLFRKVVLPRNRGYVSENKSITR